MGEDLNRSGVGSTQAKKSRAMPGSGELGLLF
jgi:hypothetical protein